MKDIFQWDNDFITNIKVIDEQHIQLINIINNGIKMTLDKMDVSSNQFEELKKSLDEYIKLHFFTEENIMADAKIYYEHIADHKKEHKEFIDTIKLYFGNDEDVSKSKINEALEYLIRWLAYHILNTDKLLCKQIELIKSGKDPKEAYEIEANKKEETKEPLLKALRALFYVVSEKNRELEKANDKLEERVRQRTLELNAANEMLESLSLTDSLTGLPNRRYFEMILQQLIENWKRYHKTFTVMFIDIDKFKKVNDTEGHDEGDILLKWIADFLKRNIRKTDTICRLGGDEFVAVCVESDLNIATQISNTILMKLLEEKINVKSWKPSLSIGISIISDTNNTMDKIVKSADTAMYISKKKGGNLTIAST